MYQCVKRDNALPVYTTELAFFFLFLVPTVKRQWNQEGDYYAMLTDVKRLGIDFGSKKIGIAISDDGGMMAFPLTVVPNDAKFFSYLETLIHERSVQEVVIGHSLNNQGAPNKLHQAVEALMLELTLQIGIPVHLEPEQYSSKQAAQIQGKSSLLDASASALILDSYITKLKNK